MSHLDQEPLLVETKRHFVLFPIQCPGHPISPPNSTTSISLTLPPKIYSRSSTHVSTISMMSLGPNRSSRGCARVPPRPRPFSIPPLQFAVEAFIGMATSKELENRFIWLETCGFSLIPWRREWRLPPQTRQPTPSCSPLGSVRWKHIPRLSNVDTRADLVPTLLTRRQACMTRRHCSRQSLTVRSPSPKSLPLDPSHRTR